MADEINLVMDRVVLHSGRTKIFVDLFYRGTEILKTSHFGL